MSLARMGFEHITIIDDDVVSEENMNSQGYFLEHIGIPKVQCLADMINRATGTAVTPILSRVTEHDRISTDILIAAVDSMKARMDIYNSFTGGVGYFIDPRMGAEYAKLVVYRKSVDPTDFYAKTWFPDSEGISEPCTAKATVYCANLLSGLVVKAVKDIVCGNPYTRNLDWDIKNNRLDGWDSDKKRII
jgi:hypothetical protein